MFEKTKSTIDRHKRKLAAASLIAGIAFVGVGCGGKTNYGKQMESRLTQSMKNDTGDFDTKGLEIERMRFPSQENLQNTMRALANSIEAPAFAKDHPITKEDYATVGCATVNINDLATPAQWRQISANYIAGQQAEPTYQDLGGAVGEAARENNPYYTEAANSCAKLIVKEVQAGHSIDVPTGVSD